MPAYKHKHSLAHIHIPLQTTLFLFPSSFSISPLSMLWPGWAMADFLERHSAEENDSTPTDSKGSHSWKTRTSVVCFCVCERERERVRVFVWVSEHVHAHCNGTIDNSNHSGILTSPSWNHLLLQSEAWLNSTAEVKPTRLFLLVME